MSKFLSPLDSQQRLAAECVSGPVVILAGAGTGKTLTITNRLAHAISSAVVDASQTLTVTFTNRAAGELRSRLNNLGIGSAQVRTFHSAALRQLRFFYPQVFTNQMPTLVPAKIQYVKKAAELCHTDSDPDALRDLAGEIEWAKVNLISPDSYRQQATELNRKVGHGFSPDQVAQVYETYLQVLDDSMCMDFEDVLLTTTAILANYPELAAQVRSQYRYFTVDEFQDVSPVQFELLSLWLGNRDDICVVGDPAQTIYEFTGASAQYLENFKEHFPRATTFELTQSYRSSPEIISVANQALSAMPKQNLQLSTKLPPAKQVAIDAFTDDQTEATQIALSIKTLIASGLAPKNIAIIYRMNNQSETFETALSNADIPFTIRGSSRYFERPEIKSAILHLRASLQTEVDRELNYQVRDVVSALGWAPKAPEAGQAAQATWESLNTLVTLADEFAQDRPDALLPEFIALLDQRNEYDHDPVANAVTLAPIHAVKGLEWEAVFVAGLSEGLVPISYATTPELIDQERRLFYVAITRAKTHLQLSWAKSRSQYVAAHRVPSRFLLDLEN
ncbi:MAG: ATP-dependent helicase [Actinobacteria bacterium]|nr:ATP-dependent helicase [Actinomycetota bacterium]NBY15256.1 ATP-dependent helicase [Actinomycetota bacterium]